jgi:hypothetical protein
MPWVFMVVGGPDTTVRRVDVLAFHEPPDYRPTARWLETFRRRPPGDRLWPHRDLRNLAGATLSTQGVTESVRQSLASWRRLLASSSASKSLCAFH